MEKELEAVLRKRINEAQGFRGKAKAAKTFCDEHGGFLPGAAKEKRVEVKEVRAVTADILGVTTDKVKQAWFIDSHGTPEEKETYSVKTISPIRRAILERRKAAAEEKAPIAAKNGIEYYCMKELKTNIADTETSIKNLFEGWKDVVVTMGDKERAEVLAEIEKLIKYLENTRRKINGGMEGTKDDKQRDDSNG